jgi:hypothetical protein
MWSSKLDTALQNHLVLRRFQFLVLLRQLSGQHIRQTLREAKLGYQTRLVQLSK